MNILSIFGKNLLHNVDTLNILEPQPYQPYEDLKTSYQTCYPGHQPQKREKIVPQVRD